jgi:hypothetical protein
MQVTDLNSAYAYDVGLTSDNKLVIVGNGEESFVALLFRLRGPGSCVSR